MPCLQDRPLLGPPDLEQEFGLELHDEEIVSTNGPQADDSGVRAVWFALEQGVALAVPAVTAFIPHLGQTNAAAAIAKTHDLGVWLAELRQSEVERSEWRTRFRANGDAR
jgi:hypothetical protein